MYSATNYTIDTVSTTDRFLTNLPDNFYATITQDIWLNAYLNKVISQTYALRVQDSLGAIYTPYTFTGTTKDIIQFNIGFNDMGMIYNANINYYDVWLVNTVGNTSIK
jgi:hypothetical protein